MQQASLPILKDLVLIGGGHSHAIALNLFGRNPLPGVRLTLITESSDTPYSGMLPGHIAGFYSHAECHINLQRLAEFAQADLVTDRAIALDLQNNKVICANHPPISFDLLSINIGSTPAILSVPGASEYVTPVKPVRKFLADWEQLVAAVTRNPQQPISLGIVGGGAGGVEVAMAMRSHLHQILKNAQMPVGVTACDKSLARQNESSVQIHLFHRDTEIMPHYNRWVQRHIKKILTKQGINLHLEETVCEVYPHMVKCESGLNVECNPIFWVTQASAPSWLQDAGLATDSKGFVLVRETLQSVSHPQVFAAGDIATIVNHPRPKAGVFAVRQGKPLKRNLQQALLEKPLKSYSPQKTYLSLIGTGDGSAIASWGVFGCQSPLLWRWKDRIDRQFMNQFSDLPVKSEYYQPCK